MNNLLLLTISLLTFAAPAYAQDKSFLEGKQLFQDTCLSCHDANLEPAKAPPMFGVQMKYKMTTNNKADFVGKVSAFVMNPSEDKALLKQPVKMLGVMPDIGAEEDDVRKIAAYIHDETFAPPCDHWKHAAERFKAEGKMKLYQRHQQKYDAMCVTKTSTPKPALKSYNLSKVTAEEGSLKAIMQQLGLDYVALESAILLQDFDAAAKAAHAMAFHDTPSFGTKMKLMASLRSDMPKFKEADDKVHNLAVEIESTAKAKDMKTMIAKQSLMLSACMACHTSYRSRIIEILK
ncbi:MAG TPA: c-type cytochrome [Ghiorsea sp.]|nr:c-type cytochrome [Ghiorsea sp.]HIP06673.1 c-type cytochrome [Mariprofundaceae bacterium]